MKFRITQYVEMYQTYEFEADDKITALNIINSLNEGRIGIDDVNGELVDENPVDGGSFNLVE